jgi:hypothetical protein
LPAGNLAGGKINETKYNKMLDECCDPHVWDRETGYPTKESLKGMGLECMAEDLAKIRKLK